MRLPCNSGAGGGGNAGFIVPDAGFLEGLRQLTRAWGFIGV